MTICDKCKKPGEINCYGFGRIGCTIYEGMILQLCDECARELKLKILKFKEE